MCGRYNLTDLPGLQQLLDILGIALHLPPPRYNIAPTENILLLYNGKAEYARWWLTPSWAPQVSTQYAMFNAKCETLSSSKAFQKPFKSQRGVVPMSSFVEWRTEGVIKRPWLVTNEPRLLTAAALWDVWHGDDEPLLSCTIVTTAAAPEFKPWHNRMPVMLAGKEVDRWLDNNRQIPPDDPLFRPELKFPLLVGPLDTRVGNARNKSPQLIEPVEEPVELKPRG
jgi:putative SOS response-associated peptidase YedK